MVNQTPSPRPMLVKQDKAAALFSVRSAVWIWLAQVLESGLDDVERDAGAAVDGVWSHVHDSILVGQYDQLLERHERLPVGAQRAVINRVEYFAVHSGCAPQPLNLRLKFPDALAVDRLKPVAELPCLELRWRQVPAQPHQVQ